MVFTFGITQIGAMSDIYIVLPYGVLAFAVAVTFFGGFVKGVVGFAMPLVMISGMGILIEPELVVAGIIIPILITNGVQVMRAGLGKAREAAAEHWRYIVLVCVMILISAQFLKRIPVDAMFVVLGAPVVVLCLVQLAGWRPRIAPRWRHWFEWTAGFLAGAMGGLAGTWGPPTVLYLLALDTPRDRQMAVQGVIYGLGSVMLLLGHLQSGVLNATTWKFSAMLVVPALVGMWLGFKFGDRFDQERFRRVTLFILIVAGLNLIRRGVMG